MSIDKHYDQSLDPSWILGQVHSAYPAGADLFQLAPLDQLHIGGIKASERLLRHLDLARHHHILDIGSGAGGLMRQASAMGFSMIGLDITHRFNQLNLGLNDCFSVPVSNPIITGDAHHLPFADQSLDLILFQHSFLNMPDNSRVLSECWRVLKPGGTLLMHEVVCGPQPEQMRYPVPWAEDAVHSHLVTAQTLQQQTAAGWFCQYPSLMTGAMRHWPGDNVNCKKRIRGMLGRAALSPALILGSRFADMGKNLVLNLEAGAIRVIELVAARS